MNKERPAIGRRQKRFPFFQVHAHPEKCNSITPWTKGLSFLFYFSCFLSSSCKVLKLEKDFSFSLQDSGSRIESANKPKLFCFSKANLYYEPPQEKKQKAKKCSSVGGDASVMKTASKVLTKTPTMALLLC